MVGTDFARTRTEPTPTHGLQFVLLTGRPCCRHGVSSLLSCSHEPPFLESNLQQMTGRKSWIS